jgi:hypothetical protein
MQLARLAPPGRRDTTNEYAALFVALIGEGPNPQGVVNTNEGKVVRAFHRFTLVDQTGQGRDLTKGRTREAGAVKISCARQDPNARNCHGYRKFVKVSSLLGMHLKHACCGRQTSMLVPLQQQFLGVHLPLWIGLKVQSWVPLTCGCSVSCMLVYSSSNGSSSVQAAVPSVWPGFLVAP